FEAGFTSAREIAAVPYEVFLERCGHRFASPREAELVHRKSQQVAAVTHTFFAAAAQLQSAPRMDGVSGAHRDQALAAARERLIERYPTLESLFGSMDFCDCEHCRS